MAELVGSIHQFLNNCKDTIVSWCKDAAKTVCLPLSGGTLNVGSNVTTTGSINAGKITVDTDSTLDNGALLLKAGGPYIQLRDTRLSCGTIPDANTNTGVYFRDRDGKNIGLIYSTASLVSNNTDVRTMTHMCVHDFMDASKHDVIAIYHDAANGFWTQAPHPMKLDTATNTFVLNPEDNSNKIATTKWVNQVLANMTKGYNTSNGTRYIKFPNGLMICAGYAANVTAGTIVNFPVAFKNMPDVVATRHWGGTGDSTAGASSTVGSAPVQVYSTTVSSFRVGVHTATAADSTAYINGSYTIYAMWIAVGEWK